MHLNPLVTVIVPCYNHAADIARCLESIFNQSFQDFELIVVDDCSQDHSVETIEAYLSKFSFKFIKNEKNLGLIDNLNKIIFNYATGQYIKCIAADDFLPKDSLEILVTEFKKQNENCAFVYGKIQHYLVEKDNHILLSSVCGKETNLQELLFDNNYIQAPSVMFSRLKYIEVGGIRDFYIEDLYLWLKFMGSGESAFVDKITAYYQVSSNTNSMSKQFFKMYFGTLNILANFLLTKKPEDFDDILKFVKRTNKEFLIFLIYQLNRLLKTDKKTALKLFCTNIFFLIQQKQFKFLLSFWIKLFVWKSENEA